MPIVIPGPSGSTSSAQSVPTQQVFDYLYDSQGNPMKGAQVTITLGAANVTTITPQVGLSSVLIRVTTDGNGYWSANLIPNANISPANTTYLIQPPGLDAYSISVPSAGGPFQSTSPSVLVNTPGVLQPATSGITGNLTVSGNESVTGNLSVAGLTTLGSTTAGATSLGAASVGGDLTIASAFRLLLQAAASKIVPGATSLSLRNNADNADNVLVTDAGAVTVRNGLTISGGGAAVTGAGSFSGDLTLAARLLLTVAVSKVVPGATSLSLRNNADSADNLLLTNAGLATLRNALSIPPTAGGTVAPTSYGSMLVKIDEKVLGGLATSWPSITIPTGFRALLVVGNAQGNAATVDIGYQFNADTAANYSVLQVFNTGTGPSGGAASTGTNALVAQANSGSSATWVSLIVNYSNTTLTNKPVTSISAAAGIVLLRASYWNQSNAITSLVGIASGNMVTNSFLGVYGIP